MLTVEQVKAHSEVSLGRDPRMVDAEESVSNMLGRLEKAGVNGIENWEKKIRPSLLSLPVGTLVEEWDTPYSKSMARLLYIHNGRASRLRIMCKLPEPIAESEEKNFTEEDIKATIDWEKFTKLINRHDDLTEDNLVTKDEWIDYNIQQSKLGKVGRNGLLDTIKNEVIDCNKIVLV